MLLDAVATGRYRLREGWKRWSSHGLRYFLFQLVMIVISLAMALPDTRNRIEAMAVEPMATDPASFNAFFRSEVTRWTEVARGAGIQAQ